MNTLTIIVHAAQQVAGNNRPLVATAVEHFFLGIHCPLHLKVQTVRNGSTSFSKYYTVGLWLVFSVLIKHASIIITCGVC